MARQDDEGYIYLVDRKKDMIITGGVNVYPREVEALLYQHPAIAEAAVVGVPDEYWGEAVTAFVVAKPGDKVSEAELTAFCAQSLAKFKVPKSIRFIDALPRNAAGKVLHRELRGA
jgi:long-chain acyl-CoA synthetase